MKDDSNNPDGEIPMDLDALTEFIRQHAPYIHVGMNPKELSSTGMQYIEKALTVESFRDLEEKASDLGPAIAAYVKGLASGLTLAATLIVMNNLKISEQLSEIFQDKLASHDK